MRRFFGTTLGQILAIVACSSIVTFLLFIAMLFYPGGPPGPPWPWQMTYRIASLVEILQSLPASERGPAINGARYPGVTVALIPTATRCGGSSLNARDLERALRLQLPGIPGITARSCATGASSAEIQVIVPLEDQKLEVRTRRIGFEPPRITFPVFGSLLFLCVGVGALSAWAVSRVIRPLRRLSDQADAFGRKMVIAPIDEEGPVEIRQAARAFNLMQERISASLENRTRMLAAISHDLRTPLTRMRLHLETERKEVDRDKLLRDIHLMQTMVTSALAFLSTSGDIEKKEWLDLGALLSTLCDDYEDSGAHIQYDGPDQMPFLCRPDAIQRAISNLIDNATSYGEYVVVLASVRGGNVMIDVTDDGPGIPEELLKNVLQPFVRLDSARSDRPGSVGLGLSIVDDIVRRHGGTLTLFNSKPSGLTARIYLPG